MWRILPDIFWDYMSLNSPQLIPPIALEVIGYIILFSNSLKLYTDKYVLFTISILVSTKSKAIINPCALISLLKANICIFFYFQLIHVDYNVNSNEHLDSSSNSYLIIVTLFMLIFDSLLYLVLTLYFDKILPSK